MTTSTFRSGSSAYVLSTSPSRAHGSSALLPVDSGEAIALVAPAIGNIPATATVTSAKLRVYQSANSWSGSTTLTAQRVDPWKVSRVTWNNRPATAGTAVAVTQSGTGENAVWEFDVTADVAAFVAGTAANSGWQITTNSTARRKIRGFASTTRKPTLEVVWSPTPPKPTDLRPAMGRAVSVTKPDLTFTASGFTSLQVQIDPSGAFTSPTFDSGEVATTVPRFALSSPVTRTASVTIPSASVSNKALTANVATLTTSAAHDFVSGQQVVVSGVDATFDGTYTIESVPTATTFTYAKTAADVASVAATGTALSTSITTATAVFDSGDVGAAISGTGIPSGTTIASVTSSTAATMSAAATASGTVTATISRSYGGLTSGSTQWRARVKAGGLWSDWSAAASFAYAALPTVTITAPGATTGDPAPPTTWTISGGTQTQYRLAYYDINGARDVYTSPWIAGTETAFTPPTALQIAPGPMRATLTVRDSVAREAVNGAPDYATDTQDYSYTRAGGIAAVTSLTAQQLEPAPWIKLTWQRTEAADQFVIERDGVEVARVTGLDLLVSGTSYAFTDWTAPSERECLYRVLPVVEGSTGDASPSVTAISHAGAVWLANPDTGEQVPVVFQGDPPTPRLSPTEVATVYETMDGRHLRHRHGTMPATDVVSGVLIRTTYLEEPLDAAATMKAWGAEVGTVYRLVISPANVAVTVGDITVGDPSSLDTVDEPVIPVSFTYWVQ